MEWMIAVVIIQRTIASNRESPVRADFVLVNRLIDTGTNFEDDIGQSRKSHLIFCALKKRSVAS